MRTKRIQRVTIFLLLVMLLNGVAPLIANNLNRDESTITEVKANSNQIRADQMTFYHSKKMGGDEGVQDLDKEAIWTLGVFASNFYIPLQTEISFSDSDEDSKQLKSNIHDVFTKTAGLSEENAKHYADVITGVMVASGGKNKVKIGVVDNDGNVKEGSSFGSKEGRNIGSNNTGKRKFTSDINFFDFMYLVLGSPKSKLFSEFESVTGYKPDSKGNLSDREIMKQLPSKYGFISEADTTTRYALLTPDNKVVFDFYPQIRSQSKVTASQAALIDVLLTQPEGANIGQILLDLTKEEMDNKESHKFIKSKEYTDKAHMEKLFKASMYNWDIHVDAFGNLILNTLARQYILLPAAKNPYIFQPDIEDPKSLGTAIPVNNIHSIVNHDKGWSTILNDGSYTADVSKTNSPFVDKGNTNDMLYILSKEDSEKPFKDGLFSFISNYSKWDLSKYISQGANNTNLISQANKVYNKGVDLKNNGKKTTPYVTDAAHPYTNMNFNKYIMAHLGSHTYSGGTVTLTAPKRISNIAFFDHLGIQNRDKFSEDDLKPVEVVKASAILKKGDFDFGAMKSGFATLDSTKTSEVAAMYDATTQALAANIYFTYVLATPFDGTNDDAIKEVNFKFNLDNIPELTDDMLKEAENLAKDGDGRDSALSDEQLANLEIWSYLGADPSSVEGAIYRAQLADTTMSYSLLNRHNEIAGEATSAVSASRGQFEGAYSFLTIPDVNESPSASNLFGKIIDFVLTILVIIIIMSFILMILDRLGVIKVLLFVFLSLIGFNIIIYGMSALPASTNKLVSKNYDDKILYWAMVQSEAYNQNILDALDADVKEDYLRAALKDQLEINPNLSTVTIKWMAPKKDNYLYTINKSIGSLLKSKSEEKTAIKDLADVANREDSEDTSVDTENEETENEDTAETEEKVEQKDNNKNKKSIREQLFGGLLSNSLSGELFDEKSNGMYLYRSFADIMNYSRFTYGNLGTNKFQEANGDINHTFSSFDRAKETANVGHFYDREGRKIDYVNGNSSTDRTLGHRQEKGFINKLSEDLNRIKMPLSSNEISKTMNIRESDLKVGNFDLGIEQSAFNVTNYALNNHTESLKDSIEGETKYNSDELASIAAFALYTESPYYYFNWNLFDNGVSFRGGEDEKTLKDEILFKNKGAFFYNIELEDNIEGYGELKDFLDMGTLFNVVIPYLHKANNPTYAFYNLYGTKAFKGITTEDNQEASFKDSQDLEKYWHNNTLAKFFSTYTAWVHAMYDTEYAKPEIIEYLGQPQEIIDPLDPKSYEVRPMVFSESEMKYYGLTIDDLTKVEQKILNVNRKTYEDLFKLVPYADFDESILSSMFALFATFNFNTEFSQNSLMAETFELYPKSFDLENFDYEGVLRMIVSETSGLDMLDTTGQEKNMNIYTRVFSQNLLGTVMLIVLDILTLWVLKYLKTAVYYLLILSIFISFIAILVNTLTTPKQDSFKNDLKSIFRMLKAFIRSILNPVIWFYGSTVLYTLIFASFASGGVAGGNSTILSFRIANPSAALAILIVLTIIYIMTLFNKVLKVSFNMLKDSFEDIGVNGMFGLSLIGASIAGAFSLKNRGQSSSTSETTINNSSSERISDFGKNKTSSGTAENAERNLSKHLSDDEREQLRKDSSRNFFDDNRRKNSFEDDETEENIKEKSDNLDDLIKKGSEKLQTDTSKDEPVIEDEGINLK